MPPPEPFDWRRWLFYAGFVVWITAVVYEARIVHDIVLTEWIAIVVPVLFFVGIYVWARIKRSRRRSN